MGLQLYFWQTPQCTDVAHNSEANKMGKKVILVTGANKGIGLAIVETLLQQLPEAVVLLGSRDASRGQAAVDAVVGKLGPGVEGRVKLLLLDVTSHTIEQTRKTSSESEVLTKISSFLNTPSFLMSSLNLRHKASSDEVAWRSMSKSCSIKSMPNSCSPKSINAWQ